MFTPKMTAFAISAFFCGTFIMQGCGNAPYPTEPWGRSDYYTRGIGKYPGNPAEDFSPSLKPDDTYRNIARLRACYASSAYDYNMTAHLATDGKISDRQPRFIETVTPERSLPRYEMENHVDGRHNTEDTLRGESTFFEYNFHNYTLPIGKINLEGLVFYNEKLHRNGYKLTVLKSDDGEKWVEVGKLSGTGKELPGKSNFRRNGMMRIPDPAHEGQQITLLSRRLDEDIVLKDCTPSSHYRVKLEMKGAYQWHIHTTDSYDAEGNEVEIRPAQFYNGMWMSNTAGKEWLYVDLGSKSEFDKINLHWVNKAVSGKVQVSDDAKTWKDIAKLPGGTALKDVLTFNQKQTGQYVRILMDAPANGSRYILSELEVMGKGGLVPVPAAVPAPTEKNRIMLSGGNWKLQRASEVKVPGEKISTGDYTPSDWIVATVPGTVLSSYKNIGALPDPNYADNHLQVSEALFWSDFWYRNEFEIPENFKKERVFLNFDGINWKANVFFNGQKIGRIEGAFIRGQYDITDKIVPGKNVVAVQIIKNAHPGGIKEKNIISTKPNGGILGADNPTFHASVGWDWIPTIRGRNIGIWNDVYLTTAGNVTLDAPLVKTVMPLPDTTRATLTAEVIVKNHSEKPVKGTLEGNIGKIKYSKEIQLASGEEKTVVFAADEFPQLNVKNPRLWWPKGYGEPYLHEAGFTFKENGKVSDYKNFKAGLRQMTYDESDKKLKIYVNGRRFIMRGGNWGFSESNLNYRNREYDIAVAYHADMNFTMIRNWVSMIGDEEFYNACDKYGIMVWQDFWLAHPNDGPNPYDPDMFMENALDFMKVIRKHPSIGLYCGRNEGYPPENLDKAFRQLIKERHADIHYIPGSADGVVSGRGPYRMLSPKEYFRMRKGIDMIHSERGMPNVMTYEGLKRTFSPDAMWPQCHQWGLHDFTMEWAQSCATFNGLVKTGFGEPGNAKEFSEWAQWVNYNGHRALFESRSKYRKGLLMWMSHSCWPSMVWQTYDYYFEPTAGYFGLKKANAPLHIQWNQATDNVEVVNYSARDRKNLTAIARIYNMDGSLAWEKKAVLDSKEDTTDECIKLEYSDQLTNVHFIKLLLEENGKVIFENFYTRGKQENNFKELHKLAKVKLACKTSISRHKDGYRAEVTVENPSEVPALMIRLNLVGAGDGEQILPAFYSDNYISLLPKEKKVLTISWKDEDSRGNKGAVQVTGFNVLP